MPLNYLYSGSSRLLKSYYVRDMFLNFGWNFKQPSKIYFLWLEWGKLAQKKDKIEKKVIDSKDRSALMNLIHIPIHCNIVNYKANLKHCAFHSLKGINTLVNEDIMLISINCYCMKIFLKNALISYRNK